MKTNRFLSLTAAAAALTLAVVATGQSTQPAPADQPRFNRPQTADTPPVAEPVVAPSTRPGTAAEVDARADKNLRADKRDMKLDRSDRNFIEEALKSGQKEIAASKAALSQLTAPGAREFAEMVVREHTALNAELTALAQRKNVDLKDVHEDRDAERATRKWSDKDDDIDENYLKAMIDAHEESVDRFEDVTDSKDADVAAFASKTLPKLQHHLEMARTQHKSVEASR